MEMYDVKRSNLSKFNEKSINDIAKELFNDCTAKDGKFIIRFGAMQPMTVWIDSNKFCVEIVTDKNVDNDTVLKTISLRNKFLETVTGYNAKERVKKLKKSD